LLNQRKGGEMICDYNFLWHPYWNPKQKSEKLNNMKKWNFKILKNEKIIVTPKSFHKIETKTNWFLQSHALPPNSLKEKGNGKPHSTYVLC
jgi:hypothetical protein